MNWLTEESVMGYSDDSSGILDCVRKDIFTVLSNDQPLNKNPVLWS
jgi:hypothetical protein